MLSSIFTLVQDPAHFHLSSSSLPSPSPRPLPSPVPPLPFHSSSFVKKMKLLPFVGNDCVLFNNLRSQASLVAVCVRGSSK